VLPGYVLQSASGQTPPGNPEVTVMPGVYRLIDEGKDKAALAVLRQAEKRGQKSWSIYHYIAVIESEYENHAEALKYFELCCRIRPQGSRTRSFLAEEELEMGQGQKAVDGATLALSYAKNIDPPAKPLGVNNIAYTDREYALNVRYLAHAMLKEFDLAIEDLNILLTSTRPPFGMWLYNRGLMYAKLNQYDRALADENRALAAGAPSHQVYFNRAATYFYLKQYDKSADDYTKLIAENSKNEERYMQRSFPYFMAGKYQLALNDVSKAQQISDYQDSGLYELAKSEIYKAWGKADLAKQCKEKARKLGTDVKDPDPWGEKAIMREQNASVAECKRRAALRAAHKH
jgi:tetratricopeptide (TPR) repeat protein